MIYRHNRIRTAHMRWIRLHGIELRVEFWRDNLGKPRLRPVDSEIPVPGASGGGGVLFKDGSGNAGLFFNLSSMTIEVGGRGLIRSTIPF